MKKSFGKCKNWFKSIPWYGLIIGLLATLGFQTIVYFLACSWIPHTSGIWYGTDPQIPSIDGRIPLIPQVFSLFYLLWYVLFPIGVILTSARITLGENKKVWINLMISWIIAIFIGGLVLIFYPTYVDRHNVAGIPGGDIYEYIKDKSSFSWDIQKFIIFHSGGEREFGCLPSFHCMQIIFCYLGVMGKKDRHIAHRLGWLAIAIIICLSTMFTKQHYFVDVLSAIVLSLMSFIIVKILNPAASILKRWPNFLIIKKLNWSHEKIFVQKTVIKNSNKKKKTI